MLCIYICCTHVFLSLTAHVCCTLPPGFNLPSSPLFYASLRSQRQLPLLRIRVVFSVRGVRLSFGKGSSASDHGTLTSLPISRFSASVLVTTFSPPARLLLVCVFCGARVCDHPLLLNPTLQSCCCRRMTCEVSPNDCRLFGVFSVPSPAQQLCAEDNCVCCGCCPVPNRTHTRHLPRCFWFVFGRVYSGSCSKALRRFNH